MANFNEVSSFVNKYVSNNGKSVEAITSYIRLDEKKIEREKDKILEFIANNIYFMHEDGCPLINLTKDLEGNTWNNLTTSLEYDVLEQLVAICFEVGLLEDNLAIRLYLPQLFGEKGSEYLSDNITDYEEFLSTMIEKVLPYFSFKFYSCDLAPFMPPMELDEEGIKELLNRWFYYYSHEAYTLSALEYFNTLLDKRLNDVLNFALFEYISGKGSTNTVVMCQTSQFDDFLDDYKKRFNQFYKNIPKEEQDAYDQEVESAKNAFFNQISLSYQENNIRKWKKYK